MGGREKIQDLSDCFVELYRAYNSAATAEELYTEALIVNPPEFDQTKCNQILEVDSENKSVGTASTSDIRRTRSSERTCSTLGRIKKSNRLELPVYCEDEKPLTKGLVSN